MNILIHNPIADMYGPHFLLFYGSAIGIVLAVVTFRLRDKTVSQPLPPIREHPNPYLIAYLRGKEENVLSLAGLSLLQKGYLEVQGTVLRQVSNLPQSSLNTLETSVFNFFKDAKTARGMLLEPSLQSQCLTYQKVLENEQLLRKLQDIAAVAKIKLIAISLIVGLGLYKLIIAFSTGNYYVGILIFMAFLAVLILLNIGENASKRLTQKGQNYLNELQTAMRRRHFNQSDENARLLVAVFGINLLANTRYENYFQILTKVKPLPSSINLSNSYDRCDINLNPFLPNCKEQLQ